MVDQNSVSWNRLCEWLNQVDTLRAAAPSGIPNGRVVMGTGVNTGWSWHLENVEFAETTIELCDGSPPCETSWSIRRLRGSVVWEGDFEESRLGRATK